jgi:hypothetical protein
MFAKLARCHGLGHRHAAPSKAAYCNDNHPVRRLASVSRAPRQALVCRWRRVPATGRLECFWQVAPVDAAAGEEPGIRRMMGRTRRPLGACLAGKSPFRRAAARSMATKMDEQPRCPAVGRSRVVSMTRDCGRMILLQQRYSHGNVVIGMAARPDEADAFRDRQHSSGFNLFLF